MSILKKLAVLAAALSLPILSAGTAAAQDAAPADGDDGAKAQIQNQEQHRYRHQHQVRTQAEVGDHGQAAADALRIRARFTDRNGDGVCDQFQQRQSAEKRLQKGKTHRNRNREGSLGRGFGRGGHAVPANGN